MILLVASLAWASEALIQLPTPPSERPAWGPVADDCPAVIAVRPGEAPPAGLLDADGRWTCSAVLTPTSDSLHRSALIAWGDAQQAWGAGVAARHRADTTAMRYQLDVADREIERLSAPPPLMDRPGTIRALADLRVVAVLAGAVYIAVRASDSGK